MKQAARDHSIRPRRIEEVRTTFAHLNAAGKMSQQTSILLTPGISHLLISNPNCQETCCVHGAVNIPPFTPRPPAVARLDSLSIRYVQLDMMHRFRRVRRGNMCAPLQC